jgi:hypothetical protein
VKDGRRGQGDVVLYDIEHVHGTGIVPPEITLRQHRARRATTAKCADARGYGTTHTQWAGHVGAEPRSKRGPRPAKDTTMADAAVRQRSTCRAVVGLGEVAPGAHRALV